MENVIACNLRVTCADGAVYENVILKLSDEISMFFSEDGKELKGEQEVKQIQAGNFLAPLFVLTGAIANYRSQNNAV